MFDICALMAWSRARVRTFLARCDASVLGPVCWSFVTRESVGNSELTARLEFNGVSCRKTMTRRCPGVGRGALVQGCGGEQWANRRRHVGGCAVIGAPTLPGSLRLRCEAPHNQRGYRRVELEDPEPQSRCPRLSEFPELPDPDPVLLREAQCLPTIIQEEAL